MKLFVYGTLKKNGFLHNFYLADSKFIKKDFIKGKLYRFLSLPFIVYNKKSKSEVPGEVYDVDEDVFRIIKDMEESSGYKEIEVKTVGGESVRLFNAEVDATQGEEIKVW